MLITGTSSGFGKLAALKFARGGDRVFASMRDTSKGAELQKIADDEGLALSVIQLDVLDDASVKKAVETVLNDAGSIDILVNNAGSEIRGAIEDVDDDEARWQFDTNFFGVLRVLRAALPSMRERGAGRVVNVSSVAGLVARPYGGMYAASKHALEGATEALHWELNPFGVRVALVEPGAYRTEFANNARDARRHADGSPYRATSDRFDQAITKLLGQDQDPQEVADMIHTAAYDESPRLRYVVGADANLITTVRKQTDFEGFGQAMRQAMDWWE
ncbi:MAG: SDR family oxidoreductase [Dehalococcoidia bacterium]